MKNLVAIIFLLFNTSFVQGQNEKIFFYGSVASVAGTHTGFHGSLETMIDKKHHFSFAYFSTKKNAPNTPEDYNGGLYFSIFGSDDIPDIKSNLYAILYGRVIPTKSKMMRFVLDAGLGIAVTERPVDFRKIENPELFGANYTYSKDKSRNLSLIIAPKVEFPLLRFAGFSTGPVVNVNSNDSGFGWILALNFGLVRSKKY